MDCTFCKIASGDIPSLKIYEDGEFLAVFDIKPANKGHFIVMPKKHASVGVAARPHAPAFPGPTE